MAKKIKRGKYYIGVDIGGTKILAALVRPSGSAQTRPPSKRWFLLQSERAGCTVGKPLPFHLLVAENQRNSYVLGAVYAGEGQNSGDRIAPPPNQFSNFFR